MTINAVKSFDMMDGIPKGLKKLACLWPTGITVLVEQVARLKDLRS